MTTAKALNVDVIEAAAKALQHRFAPGVDWYDEPLADIQEWRADARAAVTAALPVLLADLQQRIEAKAPDWEGMTDYAKGANGGLLAAAQIVAAFAAEVSR